MIVTHLTRRCKHCRTFLLRVLFETTDPPLDVYLCPTCDRLDPLERLAPV